ncbi:hypothetical protein [Nocardia sp. NPDC056100]|uniref:hypothetical protein n=1 Tax=Nocardia sp. NPDC056100 TaxID=3345712 RepID=UPI0035DECEB5
MVSVLVAVVAVAGTALGVVLGVIITARSDARWQAGTEREQLRQELAHTDTHPLDPRVEHARWQRERRETAYLDFLSALSTANQANQHYVRDIAALRRPRPIDDARLLEIRQLFKAAEQAGDRVGLEGPDTVSQAADDLIQQMGRLLQRVHDYAESHADSAPDLSVRAGAVTTEGETFDAFRRKFLEVARTALDEVADRG